MDAAGCYDRSISTDGKDTDCKDAGDRQDAGSRDTGDCQDTGGQDTGGQDTDGRDTGDCQNTGGQDTGGKDNLRVVLVSTRNPLNIGAAARAMANFGFSRLRVVNAYDVAFREARSAVGAAPLLQAAEDYASVADAVADCQLVVGTTSLGHRELQHPLRRLEYGARFIRRALSKAPVALLFGSEKFGLSNEDLSHCHWLMRIPTVAGDLSMNLGQAVALCLYELARDPNAVHAIPPKTIARAAAGETEQITLLLLEILRKSGYVNPVTAGSTEEKVRRLVRRLDIAGRDAPVLLGMLRQILWKVG